MSRVSMRTSTLCCVLFRYIVFLLCDKRVERGRKESRQRGEERRALLRGEQEGPCARSRRGEEKKEASRGEEKNIQRRALPLERRAERRGRGGRGTFDAFLDAGDLDNRGASVRVSLEAHDAEANLVLKSSKVIQASSALQRPRAYIFASLPQIAKTRFPQRAGGTASS